MELEHCSSDQGQTLLFCPTVTLRKEKINSNPVLILHFNQMTLKPARADGPLKSSGLKAAVKDNMKQLTGA